MAGGGKVFCGWLAVTTLISVLSLLGDHSSYDAVKYKLVGGSSKASTETPPPPIDALAVSNATAANETLVSTLLAVFGRKSTRSSSDDDAEPGDGGGTRVPPSVRTPNPDAYGKKAAARGDDDGGDDAATEPGDGGGTKVPPTTSELRKRGKSSRRGGGDDDGADGEPGDGGGDRAPPLHHLLDFAYLDELPSATTQQQNILLILADDMGANDIGYRSSDLGAATPTLDSLASRGVELASYYTLPSCTPARAALFTANYAANNGMGYDGPGTYVIDSGYGLPSGATLLSEVLSGKGYATHMVGKWNLGHANEAMLPHRRGFDSFIGYLGDQETYFTHEAFGTDPGLNGTTYCDLMRSNSVDGVKVGECYVDEYSTDLYARRLVDVVSEHETASSAPLFLYFAAQAPHAPLEEPPPMNATAPQEQMLLDLVDSGLNWGKRRVFAKMVMNLDNNVRKVVDALASAKLLQDTVVAFASDNGGCPKDGGSNWPLRGTKFSQYEGGVRVPAFLWSSTLQKRGAGTRFAGLFHVTDWFPTLVASAGLSAKIDKVDGVNQYDALFSDEDVDHPRDEVLIHLNKWAQGEEAAAVVPFASTPAALRWKDWKLVTNEGPMIVNTPRTNTSNCACSLVANAGSSYLFNLASDRNESVDVKDQRPDIYTKMVAKLHRYYTGAAKSAWRPEAKDLAYANWNLAENFVVPWLGNVSYHIADAPDKLVFSH